MRVFFFSNRRLLRNRKWMDHSVQRNKSSSSWIYRSYFIFSFDRRRYDFYICSCSFLLIYEFQILFYKAVLFFRPPFLCVECSDLKGTPLWDVLYISAKKECKCILYALKEPLLVTLLSCGEWLNCCRYAFSWLRLVMLGVFEALLCYKINGDLEDGQVAVQSSYGVIFLPIWVLMAALCFQACRLLQSVLCVLYSFYVCKRGENHLLSLRYEAH